MLRKNDRRNVTGGSAVFPPALLARLRDEGFILSTSPTTQMFTMSSSPDGFIMIESIDLINVPFAVLDIIRHQALRGTRDGSSKDKQQAANLDFFFGMHRGNVMYT